jgi:hypothetical protein
MRCDERKGRGDQERWLASMPDRDAASISFERL